MECKTGAVLVCLLLTAASTVLLLTQRYSPVLAGRFIRPMSSDSGIVSGEAPSDEGPTNSQNSDEGTTNTGTRADEPAACHMPGTGRFSRQAQPSTALVSFPGSGNTWTRFLLTTASGLLTGAVYDTVVDVQIGPGHHNKARRVLCVKTHRLPKETRRNFNYDRCLLLIRNPYEALLAEFNRLNTKSHTLFVVAETFQKWPSFLTHNMGMWSSLYLAWVHEFAQSKPHVSSSLHVMVYSRQMKHLEQELQEVFRFLNHSDVPAPPLVQCAVQYREGFRHRPKHDWQKTLAVFSEGQKEFLNAAIDKVQRALENATGGNFDDFQDWKR